jgi:hypothetical protein
MYETRSLVTRSIFQNRFKRNFPTAKGGRRGSHERDHLGEPQEEIRSAWGDHRRSGRTPEKEGVVEVGGVIGSPAWISPRISMPS